MNQLETAIASGAKKLADARRHKVEAERKAKDEQEAATAQRWLGVQVAVDAALGELAPFRLTLERPDDFVAACQGTRVAVRFPECAAIWMAVAVMGDKWSVVDWTGNGKLCRFVAPYPERRHGDGGGEFIAWPLDGVKVLRTSDLALALAYAREAKGKGDELAEELAERAGKTSVGDSGNALLKALRALLSEGKG